MDDTATRDHRGFYDTYWSDWDYANQYKLIRGARILGLLAEADIKKPRILDAGCGAGWFTQILAQFGPTVGLDFSLETLTRARASRKGTAFVAGDGMALPFRHSVFDVVVSQEVIEHMADQQAYLAQLGHVLRQGGALILTTPNAHVSKTMLIDGRLPNAQPIENHLDPSGLRRLLREVFDLKALETVIHDVRGGPFGALNNVRVTRLAQSLGLRGLASDLRSMFQTGLHIVAFAVKR
jgi:SAM-dependent methyltransferase